MSSFKLTILEEEAPDLLQLLEQSDNPKLARLKKRLSTNIKAHNTRKEKSAKYLEWKKGRFN